MSNTENQIVEAPFSSIILSDLNGFFPGGVCP